MLNLHIIRIMLFETEAMKPALKFWVCSACIDV